MHECRPGARGRQEGRRRLSARAPGGIDAALAAFLSGCGGLAAELALLRRLALVLGTTAEAGALGTGAFVCGLGVGSWCAARGRGTRSAAPSYGLAALVLATLACVPLAVLPPNLLGAGLVLLAIASLATLMGHGFARLFATGRNVTLVVPNLVGSVLAAGIVGNLVLPLAGPSLALWGAAGCYALAAVAARAAPMLPPGPGIAPVTRAALATAAAAGAATLAFEVLLFRRLPFFLEGFLPTLTGVLVAVLLQLAVGAALAGVVPSAARSRAARFALGGAAACALLPCVEGLAPYLADATRGMVVSTATMHARVWMVAFVAALPVVPLGAVVPLLVGAAAAPERPILAGRLWAAHGIGCLIGALCVGHLVPWLAPSSVFVVAPGVVAVLACLGLRPLSAVLVATLAIAGTWCGSAGAGTAREPRPPVAGSRFDHPERFRYLAHATDAVTTASVIYDQGAYGMALFTDEFPAAYVAPTSGYMKALAHLPMLVHGAVRDACVICVGTGTTLNALTLWPEVRSIAAVELSPAVLALADRFADDGPVATGRPAPFRSDSRVRLHATDGRHFLATAAEHSLDLVTMEPLLPYAPGTSLLYSSEFYRSVRRALRPGGICVQWVPTHAMPAELFKSLVATFAAEFPGTSLWLFDRSTLLLGRAEPQEDLVRAAPRFSERLAACGAELRTSLHECSLASAEDLALACVVERLPAQCVAGSRLVSAEAPWIERLAFWTGREKLGFFTANLAVLEEFVAAETRASGIASLRTDALQVAAARRERLEAWGATVPPRPFGTRRASATDAGTLRDRAPRSLLLWREERAITESLGGAVRGDLRGGRVAGARGILEDLGRLPAGDELVAAVRRGDPRASAYRSAFQSRVAAALCERLAKNALLQADQDAFAAVCDPASLEAAIDAVTRRGGVVGAEILPLLRPDLALPSRLEALVDGTDRDRAELAAALGDRSDGASMHLLGKLLLDREPTVRTAAGAALFRTVGDAIRYDPLGSEADRRDAARKLLELHNPRR